MANDLNNGEKLLERILNDARAEADAVGVQTEAEIKRIKELAERNAAEAEREGAQRAERARNDVLERSRTNAELDSRKYALAAKRGVVEEAFKAAFESLCALEGAKRDELLIAFAVKEADGGETVMPAKADVENIARLLPTINGMLAAAGKAALTAGEASAAISGGFMLKGGGFEKNCSFEAMLRDVRELEESSVAKILFG